MLTVQINIKTTRHGYSPGMRGKMLYNADLLYDVFQIIYGIFPLKKHAKQGVTKRCRLSWLTNSALVYEPKCGGGGGCGVSANEYSCAHGAQIIFGDLTLHIFNL